MNNVVAHSHYQGPYAGHRGADVSCDLHVCVDHMDDGSVQMWIRKNALTGVIERSARCVDASLVLHGQACEPEAYIASWRCALQRQQHCSLEAFFAEYDVLMQVRLPGHGDSHQHWLSPEFKPARQHLFGAQVGQATATITSTADIAHAMKVLVGVTAYGLIPKSLTDSLTVKRHAVDVNVRRVA